MPYGKLKRESGVAWQKIEGGVRTFRETEMLEQIYYTRHTCWEGSGDIPFSRQ